MIDLTPDAEQRFESYLTRMRAALRGSATGDDVEQSVREHVEVALGGVEGPVSADRLEPVLAQLGPPERWVSEDELPAWRRMMMRLSQGPEDWRLAYGSFALTLLMFVLMPIGGVLLLIPAYLVSRAFVEVLASRDEAIGARRWLVLPPVVIVMAIVTGIALIAPIGAAVSIGLRDLDDMFSTVARMRYDTGFLAMSAGVWWIVLAGIYSIVYRPYRAAFLPLTARLRRGHALVLTLVGAVFAAIGAVLLFVV